MALYDIVNPYHVRNNPGVTNYNDTLSRLKAYEKRADNYQKYGAPTLSAAAGIASAFGPIGGIIAAGIGISMAGASAGIKAKEKSLQRSVDSQYADLNRPQFGYAFDNYGLFHAEKPNAEGYMVADRPLDLSGLSYVAGGVKGAMGMSNQQQTYGFPTGGDANPTAPQMYDGTPQINTAQQEGNMDWTGAFNNSGNQISPPTNLKKGGKVVVGGNGNDDIALVNTNTGDDTGVRVSEGEMLVVNKDRLNALKKAIEGKNHKGVFNIIKAQIDEPVDGKNFKEGGLKEPPFDWGNAIEQGAGTAWDAYRGAEGIIASRTPVPVFQKPYEWNEFVGRARQNSYQGFTADQRAAYNLDADRTYTTDVNNVFGLSGGNAGLALSNLGRANMDRYATNLKMASLDSELQNRNMNTYGGYLTQDMGYNRQIFDDKFGIAMRTKMAGAALSQSAIQNIELRNLTNRYYGAGSQQDKLQQLNMHRMQNENDSADAIKNYYALHPEQFNPNVATGSWNAGGDGTQKITRNGVEYELDETPDTIIEYGRKFKKSKSKK